MMKSKLTLLLLTSLMLVGCGGSSGGGSPTMPTVPPPPPPPPPPPSAYTETPLNLDYSTALWYVDFESLPDGVVSESDICRIGFTRYCEGNGEYTEDMYVHLVYQTYTTVEFLNSKALRIDLDPALAGEKQAMIFIEHFQNLGTQYEELYFSYRVYYPSDFDPGMGFKTLGGLGAVVPGKPFPSSCIKNEVDAGFNVRSMIRPMYDNIGGYLETMATYHYIFHQDNPSTDFCSERVWLNNNWVYRRGLEQGYLVETRVKMNTPGVNNGEVETSINGVNVFKRTDFVFSQSGGYGINMINYVMFYGGDYTWNPKTKTYIIIDDLAVTLKSVHDK